MSTEKKYSQKDLKSLIHLATKIHTTNESALDKEFSEAEIIESAKSAGLPEESIERALEYFHDNNTQEWTPEKNDVLQFSRILDSKISAPTLESITNECRKKFNVPGTATQFGNTFEWSNTSTKTEQAHLSVNQKENIAKIDLTIDYSVFSNRIKLTGAITGFILLAIFSSFMNLDSISNWVPALVNFMGAGLGYLLSSQIISKLIKRKKRKFEPFLNIVSKTIVEASRHQSIVVDDERTTSDTLNTKEKLKH